jgi:hypothetical protein
MIGEGLVLPGFDAETGMLMLPWWAAAAVAALLVVLIVLAMLRGGPVIVVGGVVGLAFIVLVVTIVWVGSERVAERERAEERRALLTRAQDLARAAAMPGSVLACLDAAAGETVEAACERALFASPEAAAAATAYTAARIALLSDGVDYSVRANASYEGALPGLRRALETDRFGFVAQVLASHYGCSADNCDAFTLFRDTNRIGANLKERAYESYVARYAASWTTRPGRTPVASSGGSPVPPGFNVPSAAAIPPISIMVPESPAAPSPSSGAAPAEATAAPPPPPRRASPRPARPAQAAPTPQAPVPQAPVQLVPPAPTAAPAPVGNTGSATRTQ